ncbi:MAG: 3-deoxy-manno-octulosonate cytidylyltransferase, partial [Chromatiales bacterium]|nr:3-deoxy-manno-octulosonate cytidylyltransferase [Chromatiales bacterium]
PLRELAGRPLVEHAWRCAKASAATEVIVATDDERIATVARGFGARVCMTDLAHASGTDRIAEVARIIGLAGDDVVVNLQSDEPQMPPALLDQVAYEALGDREASIATLCTPIESAHELFDPNVVKVVSDQRGHALYFSRAPIPWARDAFAQEARTLPPVSVAPAGYFRHIGLYAYRVGFLRDFVSWEPCALERTEVLEQLRAMWHGHRIRVAVACERPGPGIDTPQDLAALQAVMG